MRKRRVKVGGGFNRRTNDNDGQGGNANEGRLLRGVGVPGRV